MTMKTVSTNKVKGANMAVDSKRTLRQCGRIILGAALLLFLAAGAALAWPTKYTSCSSCHNGAEPTATVSVALNGVAGTTITVAPGATFEIDWIVRNISGSGRMGMELAVPTGWTVATGTANAPALAGWNNVWNLTAGEFWWATSYSTAAEFPSSPVGYTINFDGPSWDSGTRNAAMDDATAMDLDGTANTMGTDARITVPAGAANGTYTIQVTGVGHAAGGGAKSYKTQAITVTVSSGGGDTTAPVVGTVTPANTATATFVDGTFDLSAAITEANTLSSCQYTINGGGAWSAGVVSGTAPNWTCTATNIAGGADGSSLTLNIRGTDNSANTGTGTAITRTVDSVAPTTTDNAPAGWQASDVTVTLTPADARSGVASTQYCVDTTNSCVPGTSGTSVSVTQGAGTAGTQYVRYRSTDNVGNVQTTVSRTIQIDKSVPTDGTLSATAGNTQNSLSWTVAADTGSGLRATNTYDLRFLTGATPPTCATGTSVYLGTGTGYTHTGLTNGTQYSYRLCAYDSVNNVSAGTTASATPAAGATAPTLTTPTATAILATTATLGATVTADGGAALTARGTCWATTAAPVSNCVAEGGTTVSAFTQARTALTAGTLLYYRGYATNAAGTGYSPDGSFYTEPATQASTVTFTGVTATGMTVNWTRGSGDGVIVLMKSGAAVDANPVDGTYTGYTANAAFGSGTQVGTGNYVLYKGTGTNVAVTGLSASTTYHVAVYEYKGTVDTSGVNQGANYKLTPPTGSQATAAAGNNAPAVPSALAQYQSDGTTVLASGGAATNNAVVFKATVSDPDANKVILEVDINLDGTPDCISGAVTGPATATAACTALADGSYSWQARAKDSLGATSAWTAFTGGPPDFTVSLGIDIGIDTTPPTESGLAATPGDTVIALAWNPADDGNGSGLNPTSTYKVVRSTVAAPADCSAAGIYTGNFNSYSDTGLTNGTTYYYRVCAYDRVGNVSAGQTASATPGSSCTINTPTVAILGSNKTISVDGGFVDYTVQVTNNDAGACAAYGFDLVAVDGNGAAFYPSTFAADPLNLAAGASGQTTLRVTARANQANGTTNSTYFYTAAGGGHAQSANSNAMTTTITVSGGGCVAAGNYLNANGDQLTTSR
ncbi:MAG: fibronectin type III domain-containing protein [Deltaproteobacteria bacterium]|nr:MAG: fibronectin type III domain-containing protein [Deltaproteobacteria bacterium]